MSRDRRGVESLVRALRCGDVATIRGEWESATTLLADGDFERTSAWADESDAPFVPVPPPPPASTSAAVSGAGEGGAARSLELCKFWVNSGACALGADCRRAHPERDALPESRKRWVASKLEERAALRVARAASPSLSLSLSRESERNLSLSLSTRGAKSLAERGTA